MNNYAVYLNHHTLEATRDYKKADEWSADGYRVVCYRFTPDGCLLTEWELMVEMKRLTPQGLDYLRGIS